ncbi:MAG: hypothetical protein ACFFB0_02350 [Promethearchaeota archaeon]
MQSDCKKKIGGICLICAGLFIIIPLLIWISNNIINPARVWADLAITISLWFIFFSFLLFILPAIYLIYTSKTSPIIKYKRSVLAWFITITILTFLCLIIITLAGGTIARASDGTNFISYFYQNFGFCLGLGFLFSFFIICLGLITAKLNH